jgi:hypothetical protein
VKKMLMVLGVLLCAALPASAIPVETSVGERIVGKGTNVTGIRADTTSAVVTTDAHGRLQEANLQGRLFRGGMTTTSISASTFATGDLTATGKPIVGVWNPSNSGVNLVILQAYVEMAITAATSTGPGNLVWCSSVGNTAISTGTTPVNCKTLASGGSLAKDMSGIAMTGLTTTPLLAKFASSIGAGSVNNFSFVGTAVGTTGVQVPGIENFDGGIIVPPGGIFGLFSTTTAVAHSAASSILWEEVPI